MRRIALICMLLMLWASGQASTGMYCSAGEDWYYHMAQNCQGENRGYYQDLEALRQQGKYPCPVCVPEDVPEGIMAVERGGTVVVRIPDDWMKARQNDMKGVFGFGARDANDLQEAHALVARFLHGDAYYRFLFEFGRDGAAEAIAYAPDINYMHENLLCMNERHIGGAWYVTMRPENAPGSRMDFEMEFIEFSVSMEGSSATALYDRFWNDDCSVPIEPLSGSGPVFTGAYDDIRISIFREMETNIAVIYEYGAAGDLLESIPLYIEGGPDEIPMNGYMAGDHAVYCCVLTDAEAHALSVGADAHLLRE